MKNTSFGISAHVTMVRAAKPALAQSSVALANMPLTIAVALLLSLFAPVVQAQVRHEVNHGSQGYVPSVAAHLVPVGRLDPTNRLLLAIGLPLHNQAQLDATLQALMYPASPQYHHWLTPEQFTASFGPTEAEYQSVVHYMEAHGLKVEAKYSNRALVSVSGTVPDIEKAFGVTMRVYRHPTENRTFYSADAVPSLDTNIPVLGISGLDNFEPPRHRYSATNALTFKNNATTGSGPGGNFMGDDYRKAYVPGVSLDGTGQTVALYDSPFYATNAFIYANLVGHPAPNIVTVGGSPGSPSNDSVETELDLDAIIAMAPHAAIRVYEGGNDQAFVQMAIDNVAKQISTSISWSPPSSMQGQELEQFAAQGQSMFMASGDSGSAGTNASPWAPLDPLVTDVGGTSLTTRGSGGPWQSETTWGGSAGGIATSMPLPSYQQGISTALNNASTVNRNFPDVAMEANTENTVVMGNGSVDTGWGGTSFASPMYAAFMSLVNQQAAALGKPSVGFLNPLIYAIGQSPFYSHCFHDITTGGNENGYNPTLFSAVSGYDLATGWGSPHGQTLIDALAGTMVITPSGPPPIPADVVATSDTALRIDLAWNASYGAASYNVKRSTISGGSYTTIASPTLPSYVDGGLTNGVTYYYVVSAVNTNGESTNSIEVSAQAQAVPNFGFETPNVGSGNFQVSPAGGAWTFGGGNPGGSGIMANSSAFGNPNAPEGVQAGYIEEVGTVSQLLSGFVPGTSYTLTYSAAQRPAIYQSSSETWNVYIDGTLIQANNAAGSTNYTTYTATFTATAPTHTLSFVGTDLNYGNDTVFLDNVQFSPALQPVAPVVTLSSPTNNTVFGALAPVSLTASVTTNGNIINGVQFYDDNITWLGQVYADYRTLLGQSTNAPYTFAWTGVGGGTYSVFARVLFNNGSSADSGPINFTVLGPIAADDFNYADGNLAGNNGGTGWFGPWIGSTATVVSGEANISSAANGGNGQAAYRSLATPQGPGSVAWVRFASQATTTAALPAGVTNNSFGGLELFNEGTPIAVIGKAWPGPYRWSVTYSGVAAITTNSVLTPSVLYARVTTTTTNSMIVDLWVNPTNSSLINTVTPDATETFAGNNGWNQIFLNCGEAAGVNETWNFDRLAVGATLADVALPPAPVITTQPVSVSLYAGQTTNFSVQATGSGQPLFYQWQTNNVNLVNGGNVSGVTSNVLTITSATMTNVANYYCIVTNIYGATTSAVASLVIITNPTFSAQTPAPNAVSVLSTSVLSVQIQEGSLLNTNAMVMALDGVTVTPVSITQNPGTYLATISYQPVSPMSAGTTHTVQVGVTDKLNDWFTNSWSFTTGYATLPPPLAGPITVSGGVDNIIYAAPQDPWIGSNYGVTSTNTLYTRFSMELNNMNGSGASSCYSGLEFYQGSTERLIIGKDWPSVNWSTAWGSTPVDLTPVVPIVLNKWHTMVVKSVYASGANTAVKIWLDPDFTQTEAGQTNAPLVLSFNNTFDNIRLRCGLNTASAQFSNIVMAATAPGVGFAVPGHPVFQGLVPGTNQTVVPAATPIGFQVVVGAAGVNTNSITLTVDGGVATPTLTISSNLITASYQPGAPFAVGGSTHTNTVTLSDTNGNIYSTSWTFTVEPYPALPVYVAGPVTVNYAEDIIFAAPQNEWIGTNYGVASTNTLYTRFSMAVNSLNVGGSYAGLEFYSGTTERLIIGKDWPSVNWSTCWGPSGANPLDLTPVVPIVLNQWHTMVVKSVYASGANTAVRIWLDPDFTQTEANQPNAPLVLSFNDTFDNIHLRAGFAGCSASFSNIVLAATAPGVGFAVSTVAPAVLSFQRLAGSNMQVSWTSTGTLQQAAAITGPWTNSVNQANPQTVAATNSALFFRLSQ